MHLCHIQRTQVSPPPNTTKSCFDSKLAVACGMNTVYSFRLSKILILTNPTLIAFCQLGASGADDLGNVLNSKAEQEASRALPVPVPLPR